MKLRLEMHPQLRLLAWGLHVEELEEELAFALYKRESRHVDVATVSEAERALVVRFTAR